MKRHPKKVEPIDKFAVDVLEKYVRKNLVKKMDKLAVIACYSYVSQTPDCTEGEGQNIFYVKVIEGYGKYRSINTISEFMRETGLQGVNQYELTKALTEGNLPSGEMSLQYRDKKTGKRMTKLLMNFAPVFLSADRDDETGDIVDKGIWVMGYDPIMNNYFSSIKSSSRKNLHKLTTKELDFALYLINYVKHNFWRRRDGKLVHNLSVEIMNAILGIQDRKKVQRDGVRLKTLENCKDVGLLKGFKFFAESGKFMASVADVQDATAGELLWLDRQKKPDMVTLIFDTDTFPAPKKLPKASKKYKGGKTNSYKTRQYKRFKKI